MNRSKRRRQGKPCKQVRRVASDDDLKAVSPSSRERMVRAFADSKNPDTDARETLP